MRITIENHGKITRYFKMKVETENSTRNFVGNETYCVVKLTELLFNITITAQDLHKLLNIEKNGA